MSGANPSVWHIGDIEISIRIFLALVLGGLIGLEREWGNHSAGFRTHILVCVGSALITLISIYGFSQFVYEPHVSIDPARLAAQIISGIGFLGAGTILRTGLTVSGLTTAASLWVVAAIGIGVGAGFYYGSALSTLLVLVCLFLLNKLEKTFWKAKKSRELTLKIMDRPGSLGSVATVLGDFGIQISKIQMETLESEGMVLLRLNVKINKTAKLQESLEHIATLKDVVSLETDRLTL